MAQQGDDQKIEKAVGCEKQTYIQLTTQTGLGSNVSQFPQVGLGVKNQFISPCIAFNFFNTLIFDIPNHRHGYLNQVK